MFIISVNRFHKIYHLIMTKRELFFLSFEVLAHGGGLNKQGCHNNRSTGDYHCHRGSSSNKTKTSKSGSMSFGNEDF